MNISIYISVKRILLKMHVISSEKLCYVTNLTNTAGR